MTSGYAFVNDIKWSIQKSKTPNLQFKLRSRARWLFLALHKICWPNVWDSEWRFVDPRGSPRTPPVTTTMVSRASYSLYLFPFLPILGGTKICVHSLFRSRKRMIWGERNMQRPVVFCCCHKMLCIDRTKPLVQQQQQTVIT